MSQEQADLLSASDSGDLDKVKSLLLKDPKPSEDDLRKAIGHAVASDHNTVVAFLLENGAKIDGRVTLAAMHCRSTAVFQTLLDYGWDINAIERHASVIPVPPTLWFIADDDILLEWFLDHGADPNINPGGDLSPLDRVACDGTQTAFSLLLERGARLDNSNALHAAASGPLGIPMMSFILDCGFNINAFNISKRPATTRSMIIGTALHVAARCGHVDRVRFLLDRGADRNAKHPEIAGGMTAAEWAKRFGQMEIYELLSS